MRGVVERLVPRSIIGYMDTSVYSESFYPFRIFRLLQTLVCLQVLGFLLTRPGFAESEIHI